MKHLIIALACAASAASAAPAPGSPERKAILAALRPAVEARLGPDVEFVVAALRVEPGWAFVQAEPQRRGGKAIDGRPYFPELWDDMDGLTTTAILRIRNGKWQVIEARIGATDAWYCGFVPETEFDPCRP